MCADVGTPPASEPQHSSRDLAVRTSSLVLYAILVGLAIQYGIERFLSDNATWITYVNFGTFLVTAIRFFHGNSIYHERPIAVSPLRFMMDFYFSMATLIVICVVGRSINEPVRFIFALFLLCAVDGTWGMLSMLTQRRSRPKHFIIWSALSFTFAALTLAVLWAGLAHKHWLPPVLLAIVLGLTILDYVLCRQLYFGTRQ
ncbi:hypothetical protein JXB37_04365 [candidate division WOR-3 bacterium]|nr:hypothetical protein [candidate division WOR-3 bacterium]